MLNSVELCAGAGGQALGLEQAGFSHVELIDIDKHCCNTLRMNRPQWKVTEGDIASFDPSAHKGIDLLAGGLPCPPFSVAGKKLGKQDERNLFPDAVNIVDEIRPKAVMIENVRGILESVFEDYRNWIQTELGKLGYETGWKLLNASDYGVSQLRPRVVFIALRQEYTGRFSWPEPSQIKPSTVGEILYDLMASNGWRDAKAWKKRAGKIAPTVVGGSLKHGGPDLGPTRAKRAWAALGVDGHGIWDAPPDEDFAGMPRLTLRMVARLQGFPDDWEFTGKKTPAYRQVGNAFPPPVAEAVGSQLYQSLTSRKKIQAIAG